MKNDGILPRLRYPVLAAVFLNVVINYMDRSNIAVAGLVMSKELQLDNIRMGYVFSAFSWTYASLQIPGSMLVDRFGVRKLYSFALIGWSIATVALGFVHGFVALIVLRVLIGAFEAPSYPMNNKIVSAWFPENERASAIATYTSGQFLGLAFLAPILTFIQAMAGWRGLFYITGAIGIVWGVTWYFFYRSPTEHPRVTTSELTALEAGGAVLDNKRSATGAATGFKWADMWLVLSKRKLWGIYIGQFCLGATMNFFLTWFPKYLFEFRKMDFIKSGFYASIPFLCAFAGILLAGYLSDYLVRKGVDAGAARKTPIIAGMLLSVVIVFANFVQDPFWVIFFMSLAFFGNGFASVTWVFVSLLAPKHLIGLTGGVFNFFGGLASMIVPVIVGYLAQDGDFAPALIFISCITFCGALSYIFLTGKMERV